MFHSLRNMIGRKILATDGVLGKVIDIYFDDLTWTARYVVVETGIWLSCRQVLLSLISLGLQDWNSNVLIVNINCEKVRNSPYIDTMRPVFRQNEILLHEYYQWSNYWDNGNQATSGLTSIPLFDDLMQPDVEQTERINDTHLRSICQVTGYTVHANDGIIGEVDGFIVENDKWKIKFIAVATGSWMTIKKVLVYSCFIHNVNWSKASIYLDCSKETIKETPMYNSTDSDIHYDRTGVVE